MTSQNNIEYRLGVLSRVGVRVPDGFGGQRPISADDLITNDPTEEPTLEFTIIDERDYVDLGLSARIEGTLKITKLMGDLHWSLDDAKLVAEHHKFDPIDHKYIKNAKGYGLFGMPSEIPADLSDVYKDPWLVLHVKGYPYEVEIVEITRDRTSARSRAADINTVFDKLNEFMCVRLRDVCPAWIENMDEPS